MENSIFDVTNRSLVTRKYVDLTKNNLYLGQDNHNDQNWLDTAFCRIRFWSSPYFWPLLYKLDIQIVPRSFLEKQLISKQLDWNLFLLYFKNGVIKFRHSEKATKIWYIFYFFWHYLVEDGPNFVVFLDSFLMGHTMDWSHFCRRIFLCTYVFARFLGNFTYIKEIFRENQK